jgi:hypothetical protein
LREGEKKYSDEFLDLAGSIEGDYSHAAPPYRMRSMLKPYDRFMEPYAL